MHDCQLFQQILGLTAPWSVQRVELDTTHHEVHVHLQHDSGTSWPCPECGRACPLHDHQGPRTWRHLDTCQYQTLLHAEPPRTNCPEHGVRLVRVPWAEPYSRFTLLFERLAIDWMQSASQQAVAKQMGLSWDEVHGIMQRAVNRGLKRRKQQPIPRLGVDEKAFRKGHRYATLVNDLDRGCVLYVAEDREAASLDEFWKSLTQEQLASIEAVAMDMSPAYTAAVLTHVPEAETKIVYDKFHVAKHLGEAVDRVRRAENKALCATGDRRLVGSKYDWLRNPAHFSSDQWRAFQALRESNLKTARAWAMKEQAMLLWDYCYEGSARKHFALWYRWATHSRLQPMIQAAKMIKRHIVNILTYLNHGITNATSESINSKIQWIKYTARGFRNFQNFVTAIYFHCGGLDLAPGPT